MDYQQLCELADREIRLGMTDERLMHRALQQSGGVVAQAHQTYWRLRVNQILEQAAAAGNFAAHGGRKKELAGCRSHKA